MAVKSKSESALRKSKSSSYPKVSYLTPIRVRTGEFGKLAEFLEALTPAETLVINPLLRDLTFPRKRHLDMLRLLGRPIEQCKVIPFPLGGTRGAKFAKEA